MASIKNWEGFSFFSGKRVLVTGHTGFKGSWLSLWLLQMGARVAGYALSARDHPFSHFKVLQLQNEMQHDEADLRDRKKLREVLQSFSPEIIFHLAAQPLVRESYLHPLDTLETNVLGSAYLLEEARHLPSLRSLIYVTSDKCYLNKEWVWGYRESDELGGKDPYSASKAAAEIIFYAYSQSFFSHQKLGRSSVRAGNVIGGGDSSPDRIIPDAISAFQKYETLHLRSPRATRPWQHVLDPLFGYLKLAYSQWHEPEKFSGSWNFGPSEEVSATVEALIRRFRQTWGSGEISVDRKPEENFHEAGLLRLSSDKAQNLLGWKARWSFEKATDETALWYKRLLSGESAREVSLSQIADYVGDRR